MKVLVAGIGNIFMGDDGFGCEVIQKLNACELPNGPGLDIDVVDFGIRGMDLGYALMDGYDLAILIDTVDQGGEPGSVYVIEPEIDDSDIDVLESGEQVIAPHEMDPAKVLRFISTLGDKRPRVLLVGCQPEFMGGDDGHMGLSDAVTTAVDKAVTEVQNILQESVAAGHANPPVQQRLLA